MKILQISPQLPLPLDDGGRKSIYGIFRTLSELGHNIHFICYDRTPVTDRKELLNFGRLTTISGNTENSYFRMFLNLFSAIPYHISKYHSLEMKNKVIEILENESPDLVHIDHLHMVWLVEIIKSVNPKIPVVLREHNLETLIMKRFAEHQTNIFIRLYANFQFYKLKKYESAWTSKVDLNIMISKEDEKQLRLMNPDAKSISIPAGFDNLAEKYDAKFPKIKGSICHIGPMEWQPNKDSLEWLLSEILPELVKRNPKIKLYVFGKGTEKIQINESMKNNVSVVGYAENLWDELSQMEILVVPLRIGGGIRIKIIEAMGMGLPIVTTDVGCEGIDAVDGEQLLIGNSVQEISDKIIQLLESENLRNALSGKSVEFVRKNYSWIEIGKRFVNAYQSLTMRSHS